MAIEADGFAIFTHFEIIHEQVRLPREVLGTV